MTQQPHSWVSIQQNSKQDLTEISARPLHIICCSTIHNSQGVEANQICTDRWMDRENVVYTDTHTYTYNAALKKEGNSDICYNMDGSWARYAKWNKPVTEGQILLWFHSYEEPEANSYKQRVTW